MLIADTTIKTSDDLIALMEKNKATDMSRLLFSLVQDSRKILIPAYKSWLEYKGDVAIKLRSLPVNKANNQLANDFRGLIVDQSRGYLFGNPVNYSLQNSDDAQDQFLSDFVKQANLANLDPKTSTKASATGYAVRLCYIDKEGKEQVADVPPWECFFIYDESLTDTLQFAMRYYDMEYFEGNERVTKRKIEWYDRENITYYISDKEKEQYWLDPTEEQNPQPHGFTGEIPLVKFKNNELEQSDFEKVGSLIDGYDKLTSDTLNEVEEFRLAYLLFFGTEPDAELIKAARQTGAFGADKDDRIEFLTKQINDTFVENTKKTLEKNIYRFARAIDMTDENFSGAGQSGESRKWKLIEFENKCKDKEREFISGTKNLFKTLAAAWKIKGIDFPYEELEMEFKRNLPKDLGYEAQTTSQLKGNVSEITRLGLLSFIDNPQAEMDLMKEEADTAVNFDTVPDQMPGETNQTSAD